MICASLVNTQTHTDSFKLVILLAQPDELKTDKNAEHSRHFPSPNNNNNNNINQHNVYGAVITT